MNNYSINQNANTLLQNFLKEEERLDVKITKGPLNSKIIDAGINTIGSIEAGLRISEICMGGLGKVNIYPCSDFDSSFYSLGVHSSKPVLACLGSQYAGWSLNHEDFFSLGSGPARSIAQKEEIFSKLNYRDQFNSTCIILEVDKLPPEEVVKKISKDCSIATEDITFILTPTTSICGTIQVVARVLEVAIHKIHELNFPLNSIQHGFASAPLPPVASDFLSGMGRTNDAIIYGGKVSLCIEDEEDAIINLSKKLPSFNSKDYGKPFKKIFMDYDKDFYKIDGSLFSPACVTINSKKTGKSYQSGKLNKNLVDSSFFS